MTSEEKAREWVYKSEKFSITPRDDALDEAVNSLEELLDQHAEEQREACAKAIDEYADAKLIGHDLDIAITCWKICRAAKITGDQDG